MVTSNLPYYATPFVGRLHEIAEVTHRLDAVDCRLLTLVGPGGIGKTRLAVEAAQRFPSAYFVALQPLASSDFVVSAIANAVGLQFYAGADPQQQLFDFLREKVWLLVLDNFEHLLDSATLLAEILAAAPSLRMLVTSRERLHLVEEWTLEVSGLSFPTSGSIVDPEHYSAVELFVQRAQRINVGFEWGKAQQVAVGRICRLVDGMPLGIELAANWVRVLSCEAIADEIERSLDILETPARNIEPRHRTMRAAFTPTWNRLSEDERAVFMKLSVFRGGFTREAAEFVAEASLRTLSALLDKSLLRVDTHGRYDLHELLRQYGEDQLDASPGDAIQTRDSHCDYYTTLLEAAWPLLNSSETIAEMSQLDLELENIRTTWEWALHQHNAGAIEKALPSLNYFYDIRARYHEGEQAYGRAAAVFGDSTPDSVSIRAKLRARQGSFCHDLGLTDKASTLLLESVEMFRSTEAYRDLANALKVLGVLYEMIDSDMAVASAYYQESLALYAKLGDRLSMAGVFIPLSHCYGIQGLFDQAMASAKESLAICQQFGNRDMLSGAYSALGSTAYQLGDYQQCKTYIEKSLVLDRESSAFIGVIFSVGIMSAACSALGEYDQARRHILEGFQAYRDSGQARIDRFTLGLMVMAIRVCLGDNEVERGYELMGLVDLELRSFGTHRKFWAWSILDLLDGELPPNLIAAVERGRAWNIEAAMQTITDDFNRSLEKNAAAPTLAIPSLLTQRELEILALIADGFSNSEIAEQIIFSTGTVKWYVHQILGKLDVTNRTQAVARARTLGLLP